ncbi:alpha/beta hydrolase [Alteromonas gracilis]|uniref:alpha/beta hydrolase n=1 Tax=Alteromonas gracilis TaxID=1479524 RepID=UPI0030D0BA63
MFKFIQFGVFIALFTSFTILANTQVADKFSSEYLVDHVPTLSMQDDNEHFSFTSFDGQTVNGRLSYPKVKQDRYPVLIAMHAMGRSFPRWWNANLKGSPTVTQAHKVQAMASHQGFSVIALDARHHGTRKVPDYSLLTILDKLEAGDSKAYEAMIQDTVKDYKVILNWISEQSQFKDSPVYVVGYSMGAQMALLLAASDQRIDNVISIVPPHVEDSMPHISPHFNAARITNAEVLLLTANQDEYATNAQFANLFEQLSTQSKRQVVFNSGHILPANYTEVLEHWFAKAN